MPKDQYKPINTTDVQKNTNNNNNLRSTNLQISQSKKNERNELLLTQTITGISSIRAQNIQKSANFLQQLDRISLNEQQYSLRQKQYNKMKQDIFELQKQSQDYKLHSFKVQKMCGRLENHIILKKNQHKKQLDKLRKELTSDLQKQQSQQCNIKNINDILKLLQAQLFINQEMKEQFRDYIQTIQKYILSLVKKYNKSQHKNKILKQQLLGRQQQIKQLQNDHENIYQKNKTYLKKIVQLKKQNQQLNNYLKEQNVKIQQCQYQIQNYKITNKLTQQINLSYKKNIDQLQKKNKLLIKNIQALQTKNQTNQIQNNQIQTNQIQTSQNRTNKSSFNQEIQEEREQIIPQTTTQYGLSSTYKQQVTPQMTTQSVFFSMQKQQITQTTTEYGFSSTSKQQITPQTTNQSGFSCKQKQQIITQQQKQKLFKDAVADDNNHKAIIQFINRLGTLQYDKIHEKYRQITYSSINSDDDDDSTDQYTYSQDYINIRWQNQTNGYILDLSQNELLKVQKLLKLNLQHIRILKLDNCQIDDNKWKILVQNSRRLVNLRVLQIRRNCMQNISMQDLESFQSLKIIIKGSNQQLTPQSQKNIKLFNQEQLKK